MPIGRRKVYLSNAIGRRKRRLSKTSFGWALWIQWVLATSLSWAFTGWFVYQVPWFGFVVSGVFVGTAQWFVLNRKVFKFKKRGRTWILASTIGWPFGLFVGALLTLLVVGDEESVVGYALYGAVVGAVVGTAQHFVLKKIPHRGLWILANTVGWGISWPVIGRLYNAMPKSAFWNVFWRMGSGIMVGAVAGAITGGVLVWLVRPPRNGLTQMASVKFPVGM